MHQAVGRARNSAATCPSVPIGDNGRLPYRVSSLALLWKFRRSLSHFPKEFTPAVADEAGPGKDDNASYICPRSNLSKRQSPIADRHWWAPISRGREIAVESA